MTKKTVPATLATGLLFLVIASQQARSSEVVSVMALCDSIPACSHSIPDRTGRVLFKLHGTSGTKTIQCEWDGNCSMFLPRGQRLSIKDVPAMLLSL